MPIVHDADLAPRPPAVQNFAYPIRKLLIEHHLVKNFLTCGLLSAVVGNLFLRFQVFHCNICYYGLRHPLASNCKFLFPKLLLLPLSHLLPLTAEHVLRISHLPGSFSLHPHRIGHLFLKLPLSN
ncbi:hypothetical protein ABW19_dt0205922 [Dactylella cylindrospora]|nr:hypothetical protein ABW19_dt0205922 [Dactylella cylindrospora]